jgi:hypothetical protein
MTTNAFIGNTEQPSAQALAGALGAAKPVWDQLLADVARNCGADVQQWKSYSHKYGWSLRVMRKKRTIVWLSPSSGSFTVLFILGEKAMRAARGSGLPKRVLAMMDKAPKYPEGTGLRFEIKTAGQLGVLNKLAAIKLAN